MNSPVLLPTLFNQILPKEKYKIEVIVMSSIKVIKKNGDIVEFEPQKVYDACKSAGASDKIARDVTDAVVEELHAIKSEKIRRLTLEKLKEVDKETADNWIKYDIQHGRHKEESFLNL